MKSLAAITAYGAWTPLGLSAMESAFMVRTGLPAMREAPILDLQEAPVIFCALNLRPTHMLAAERALSFGTEALHECTGPVREFLAQSRFRVVCCLDEFMTLVPEGLESSAQYIANGLRDECRRWFDRKVEISVSPTGGGGFGALLPPLLKQLAEGELEAVLIGGLHSDYHPLRIQSLDGEGRLFSREHLDAVIPGEGAAFVLLTTSFVARRMGWPIWGTIHGIGSAFERANPDNDESAYEAAGMTVALRRATEELRAEGIQVGWQLQDVGFEHYRLAEWQALSLRCHEIFCEPYRVDSVPHRFGYLGGATLPVQLIMAAEGWRRGWAPHPWVVSLSGSDSGARTAVLASNVELARS